MLKTLIADQIGAVLCPRPSIRVISHDALPTHAEIVAPAATCVYGVGILE